MQESIEYTLNLLTSYLNLENTEMKTITCTSKIRNEELRDNFIKVCFCPEKMYEKFIMPKGKNPRKKTSFDKILDENKLIVIAKLLTSYAKKMHQFKEQPFPVDKFEFMYRFFNFIMQNPSQQQRLNMVVSDKNYLKIFLHELRIVLDQLNDMNLHEYNTRSVIMNMFINLMLTMEQII